MTDFCVGLTGNIGSGKSTVAKILAENGFSIISADQINKDLLKNSENLKWIADNFGSELITPEGLDTKKLASIIFNNTEKKTLLESHLHPQVNQEFKRQLKVANNPACYDIPLLFEIKREIPEVRYKVVVYSPKELCLQRVIARDNTTYENALRRYENQIPMEDKIQLADFVIRNEGSLEDLNRETIVFIQSYLPIAQKLT